MVDTNGRKYLFTGAALDEANARVDKNPEDIPNGIPILNPEQVLMDRDQFLTDALALGVALESSATTNRLWLYTTLLAIPLSFAFGFGLNYLF